MYRKGWIEVMFDVLFDWLKCFNHFASGLYDSTIPYPSFIGNYPLIKFSRFKKKKLLDC
jgi:hypothetical protein